MSENKKKDNSESKTEDVSEGSEAEVPSYSEKPKSKRFVWLDQFRGLVILLFIISAVTWTLSKDLLAGEFPVMPVYYDHGWRLFNSYYSGVQKYDPAIITIIDIGQQIFIFLVGFMQAFSYMRRKKKNDLKNARMHILTRFGGIMLLSFIDEVLLSGDIGNPSSWAWGFLFYGTLANIAWASLMAGVVMELIDEDDHRFYLGFGLLILHAVLYASEGLRNWEAGWFKFPWNTLGHIGISIIATAYSGWFFDDDLKVNEKTIRDRVLPVSTSMFILNYVVDWLQWAQHHRVTMALAVLAIGTSGFMIWIFYILDEKWDFQIPGLTVFGKNMLMMFILSLIVTELYLGFVVDLSEQSRVAGLFLSGIIPVLIMWVIAKLLDKFNLTIKI